MPFVTGLLLGLSLIVAIGAQNAFVLRQGLRGEHVGVVVAICVLSDAALIAAGVGGLAALLGESPALLDAMALAGAAFLARYAYGAARRALAGGALVASAAAGGASRRRVVAQALAFTWLNPHVYLDTVLLVGAVGAQQAAAARPLYALGACTASLLWFGALGIAARRLAPVFARPVAWRVLDGTIALTMALQAAVLARGVWTP